MLRIERMAEDAPFLVSFEIDGKPVSRQCQTSREGFNLEALLRTVSADVTNS